MIELSITKDFHNNQDWRNTKPVCDREKCVQCGICYLLCPDSAIHIDEERYYEANLDHCKGCGLCASQCPTGCINMEEEEARLPWQLR